MRLEGDYSVENISNGQNNSYTSLYLSQRYNNKEFLGALVVSNIISNLDTTAYAGGYYYLDSAYFFVNLGITPQAKNVASAIFELETGFDANQNLTLTGYYRFQNYNDGQVNTYAPGFNYYFGQFDWTVCRFYLLNSTQLSVNNSWYD